MKSSKHKTMESWMYAGEQAKAERILKTKGRVCFLGKQVLGLSRER